MSNLHIVQDTSLIAIADAVRDKLGEGSSIDDPGKGYYPALGLVSSFPIVNVNYSVSPSQTVTYYWCSISDYSLYFDKPFKSVEISWTPNSYANLTVNTKSGDSKLSPYTVTFDNLQTNLTIYSFDRNVSYSPYSCSYSNIVIKLKDENGNYLIPKQNQLSYTQNSSTIYTTNFQSELVPTPIPMSLTDINNNISTYLTSNTGGGGTLETWKWSETSGTTYLTFPSGFSIENLKDLTCYSNNYPRGLYKDSLGKPVSMKDQGISLPSSFSTIGYPLTVAKISTAHSEGRTFCIPWNWTGTKTIPDNTYFVWFIVEPNDSKIYLGIGRYANYVGNGNWTVIYT